MVGVWGKGERVEQRVQDAVCMGRGLGCYFCTLTKPIPPVQVGRFKMAELNLAIHARFISM